MEKKYLVEIIQSLDGKYPDKVLAKFGSMEEAVLYCSATLSACENTKVQISITENDAEG